MEGVAAVVHLAGVGGDYTLEDLFRVNARGMFDVFEAARLAGVQRIVFASSNHAFGCYPIEERVSPALPPRPDSLYGTFKAWGETMLRCYFDRHGIRSVCCASARTARCRSISARSLPGCRLATLRGWWMRAAPSRSRLSGGERLFRQHAHQDIRSELGVPRLPSAGQCRGPLEMLRGKGVDVDGPWEWPEHGGSHARAPERPPRQLSWW